MKRKFIAAMLMICSMLMVKASGQKALRGSNLRSDPSGNSSPSGSASVKSEFPPGLTSAFELTGINEEVIEEFKKAWQTSGNGQWRVEGLVLIYRNRDGFYKGVSLEMTNENRQFTFKWDPDAIAIVHTHPNDRDPRPDVTDRRVADKLGVPVFTITSRGMYLYDPMTKETVKVKDGLDWLDPAAWYQASPLNH